MHLYALQVGNACGAPEVFEKLKPAFSGPAGCGASGELPINSILLFLVMPSDRCFRPAPSSMRMAVSLRTGGLCRRGQQLLD